MVAVGIVGVGQHAGHVRFRQQTQADGIGRADAFGPGSGEAGDQACGFLAAFRVYFFDKIVFCTAKVGQQHARRIAGQGGDKVGLARLTGAKDAHAHLAHGRLLAFAEKTGRLAHVLLQGRAFAAHQSGVVRKPAAGFTGGFGQLAAVPRQFAILLLHDVPHISRRRSRCPCPASSLRPV